MAHYNYYVDLCVEAYIVNDGAVLLRLHDKYDLWTAPGGHIEPGEDMNEAALREVMEEAGLEVELVGPSGWVKRDEKNQIDLVPPIFVNRHRINEVHEHSASIFLARSSSRVVDPQGIDEKPTEFRWVTLDDLDEMVKTDPRMRPETYRYAAAALQQLT